MIRPVVANNHVLRSVRLLLEAYAGAPLPEWDAFARTIRGFHLDAGDVLFAAREVHPFLYFVNEGLFKAEMVNVRGRPVVTFFADEGELLVSMPALAPQGVRRVAQRNLHPRTSDLAPAVEGVSIHTVSAIASSVVVQFDYRIVERLASRRLAWASVASAISMTYAITLQTDAVTLREAPEQRFRQLLAERPDLIERLSRKDLASYLGITDVALGRIAKRVDSAPDA